jgi:hypothetical protein
VVVCVCCPRSRALSLMRVAAAQHNNVYILAVTKKNSNVTMVLTFLSQLVTVRVCRAACGGASAVLSLSLAFPCVLLFLRINMGAASPPCRVDGTRRFPDADGRDINVVRAGDGGVLWRAGGGEYSRQLCDHVRAAGRGHGLWLPADLGNEDPEGVRVAAARKTAVVVASSPTPCACLCVFCVLSVSCLFCRGVCVCVSRRVRYITQEGNKMEGSKSEIAKPPSTVRARRGAHARTHTLLLLLLLLLARAFGRTLLTPSLLSSPSSLQVTSAVSWRAEGIRYRKVRSSSHACCWRRCTPRC